MNLKTFTLGFICGGFLVGLLALFQINEERTQKYEMGKDHGSIEAFVEIYDAIKSEYGPIQELGEEKLLYSQKATDIVVVEENGVKTIRAK